MPAPLFKIVYEAHAMPLDGFQFTRAQVVRAQQRCDLGRVVVVESVPPEDAIKPVLAHAMVVGGVWKVVHFNSKVELRKLIVALDHEETHEPED